MQIVCSLRPRDQLVHCRGQQLSALMISTTLKLLSVVKEQLLHPALEFSVSAP